MLEFQSPLLCCFILLFELTFFFFYFQLSLCHHGLSVQIFSLLYFLVSYSGHTLIDNLIWLCRDQCSITIYLRSVLDCSQPICQVFFNVSVTIFVTLSSLYGKGLNSRSICLAVECCMSVLYLSLIAIGIVDDLKQLLHHIISVSSFSTFSFFPLICFHALIMRNLPILLSRHRYPFYFVNFFLIVWVPY